MSFYSDIFTKLLHVPGIGSKTAQRIVETTKDIVKKDEDFIKVLLNLKDQYRLSNLSEISIRDAFFKAENSISESIKNGVKTVSILDEDYPVRLKEFKTNPPVLINYKGDISSLSSKPSCAVIGTREPSGNGYSIGVRVGELLAENDVVVVSGLAKGCDTAGHLGCLNKNGKTVAVLAHGLKHLYPKENRKLADNILEKGGALISEYFYDQTARANFFVERDRIQAGLSDNIFVVETGVKGGTMHTVKYAIENDKKVFTYKHPEKYLNEDKALGNQMLINESKATPVGNASEFSSFLLWIYNHQKQDRTLDDHVHNMIIQTNVFRDKFPSELTGEIYQKTVTEESAIEKSKIRIKSVIKKLKDQHPKNHSYTKVDEQHPKDESHQEKEHNSLKKESEGEKKNASNDSQIKLWE